MEDSQTVRHHHTGSRAHIQGASRPLRVRHSARNLTDGAGLVLVRKLLDRFGLAGWIDGRAEKQTGFFRPGLMTEVWIALQLYGGGVMDDLPLLDRRGAGWSSSHRRKATTLRTHYLPLLPPSRQRPASISGHNRLK